MAFLNHFVPAYVVAAFSAAAAALVIYSVQTLPGGWADLRDLGSVALIFVLFSLGYTLFLGLIGWGLLRYFRWSSPAAYGAVGAILAFLVVAVFDGIDSNNPFLLTLL